MGEAGRTEEMRTLGPREIEARSMEIIARELTVPLAEPERPVVMRVIHATADFSFAENLRFTPGVIARARALLAAGATVVTDTNMALSGISRPALAKLGARAVCFMADGSVVSEAAARGTTRASVSAARAAALPGPKLLVCGNAPTFLFSLLEHREQLGDAVIIGVPVGFVNVVEAKEALLSSGLPSIVAAGRRGGSGVAAAIVNALLYGIEGVRA